MLGALVPPTHRKMEDSASSIANSAKLAQRFDPCLRTTYVITVGGHARDQSRQAARYQTGEGDGGKDSQCAIAKRQALALRDDGELADLGGCLL